MKFSSINRIGALAGKGRAHGRRRLGAAVLSALGLVMTADLASGQYTPPIDSMGAPDGRVILIATRVTEAADGFVSQVHPRVARVPLISGSFIDPDHDLVPNWDFIETRLNKESTPAYDGVICLNWEAEFFEALKTGPSHPQFLQARSQGIAVVNFIKGKRPNAKVGYYSFPSGRWNVDWNTLQPLVDAVDVMMPGGAISNASDYTKQKEKMHKNVKKALELSNGKPVLTFHSPRETHAGMKLLDQDLFRSHVETTFDVEVGGRHASGIIIWDPTMRLLDIEKLPIVDSEYIPQGMGMVSYATQLQKSFICAAMMSVIPDMNCYQPMPSTGNGAVASDPNLPDQDDTTSGWTGGGVGGAQQRRHIIHLEPQGDEDDRGQGHISPMDSSIAGSGSSGSTSGIGLAPLNPHISGWSFTNMLWTSSPWALLNAEGEEVEANGFAFGYPLPGAVNETAQTVIGAGMTSVQPPGKWLTLFEGQGTIELTGDATVIRESQGRILFRVTPTNEGVVMRLTGVPAADPLRNVRAVPINNLNSSGAALHPQLTNRLKAQQPGVLRFATWQQIDGSPLSKWADRITLQDLTQVSDRGAAIELMISLCNEVGADPWFCMPHQADDAFVQEFAALVAEELLPDRRVYVEHSNDVLNESLPQYEYLAELGADENLDSSASSAAALMHAQRSQEILAIWREVFEHDPERVVGVLSVPGDQPEAAGYVISDADAVAAADVIAVSGGFGGAALVDELELTTGPTVDSTVALLTQARLNRLPAFEDVASMVRMTGKPMVVSHAGAGLLVGAGDADQQLIELLRDVEQDPRTIELVQSEVAFWQRAGAVLILTADRPAVP